MWNVKNDELVINAIRAINQAAFFCLPKNIHEATSNGLVSQVIPTPPVNRPSHPTASASTEVRHPLSVQKQLKKSEVIKRPTPIISTIVESTDLLWT